MVTASIRLVDLVARPHAAQAAETEPTRALFRGTAVCTSRSVCVRAKADEPRQHRHRNHRLGRGKRDGRPERERKMKKKTPTEQRLHAGIDRRQNGHPPGFEAPRLVDITNLFISLSSSDFWGAGVEATFRLGEIHV